MLHLMKYSMKWKLKNFDITFWPLVFPMILATLFYLAFGRIEETDFETIPVAVVEESSKGALAENSASGKDSASGKSAFQELLRELEDSGEALVQSEKMTDAEAKEALSEKEISGIFYIDRQISRKNPAQENVRLTVGESGIAQSILQSVLESYENGKQTLETVARVHPEGMEEAIAQMAEGTTCVEQVSLGGKTTNKYVQFFYALIAMACLYGCFIGLGAAESLNANQHPLAIRRCAAPVGRLRLILTEMCISFVLHFVNVVLLILYIRYALRQELYGSLPQMLLTAGAGSIIGVSLGMFVGSMSSLGEGVRTAILLGISMSLSFFAGLMDGNMKNTVEQIFPIANRLNPAAVITDALYCINVYDDSARYYRSILSLWIMAAVLIGIAFGKTRRERYDSI